MKKMNLTIDPTTGDLIMQFLSGVSYSFASTHGFYIADSACGDGKTTIIAEIAKQMFRSGVLIIVQTTEAADKLFVELCKTISPDLICLLHSQEKAEKYMVEHREKPTVLWIYSVLIITAVRFQHYPLDLFLKFDLLGNKYRKFVLIDEIICFFPLHPVDLQKLLPDITYISYTKASKKGRFIKEIKIDSTTLYQHLYRDCSIMEAGVKANPIHKEHFKNPLARYRLHDLLKYASTSGSLQAPPLDIDTISANSTVILFDGTADVLFPGDKRLLSNGTSQRKYSSDIVFEQFHLPFRRRNGSDWNLDDLNTLGDDLFKWIANMTQTEKPLIISWKDIERKVKGKITTDDLETKESFNFPDILSELLEARGAKKDNYGIIYRGSGLERGCNDFRDFDTIIFLGEWFISDDITPKLNEVFKAKSTFNDYKKSLLIQSICRLRIRKHNGDPIKVCFSDDMDYNLMYEVQEYFKANSTPRCTINGVIEPLPRLNRQEKNHLFDIAVLGGDYPQLIDSLSSNKTLALDIPKSELFRILPKDRKSVDRYRSLIGYLLSHGITISII